MSYGLDTLMKAIEFERRRSKKSVPLAKRLSDLMKEEEPHFKCRDGTTMPVSGDELRRADNLMDEREKKDLILPVYLKPNPGLGHGYYQLLGLEKGRETEDPGAKLLFRLLETRPRSYLYTYEVQRARKIIPSLIFVFY